MSIEEVQEILEGNYLKKEYINNRTLLFYKEEDGYLRIQTLFVREDALTTIEQDIVISIPLNQISDYEVQVNENGIAIFRKKRLIKLYDAQKNMLLVDGNLLTYLYNEMFQEASTQLKKVI